MDGSGKVVINPQFDKAGVFSDGLAAVKLGGGGPAPSTPVPSVIGGGGRYGYINSEGKYVVNPQFDDAGTFVRTASRLSSWVVVGASLTRPGKLSSIRNSTKPRVFRRTRSR